MLYNTRFRATARMPAPHLDGTTETLSLNHALGRSHIARSKAGSVLNLLRLFRSLIPGDIDGVRLLPVPYGVGEGDDMSLVVGEHL